MKPITERTLIRRVAARWREQYADTTDQEKSQITHRLDDLDTEAATVHDVAGIIGNRSWTERSCDECGAINVDCIRFEKYESKFDVCRDCIRDASNLLAG